MKPARILEAALYVTDLDAAQAFYSEVIGLEPIAAVPLRHAFFRCGDGVLLIFNAEATQVPAKPGVRLPVPQHGTTGEGHLCFAASAEEIVAWRDRLEQAGVEIEADFEWPGGGRSIYLRDPSGNSIEFAEPRIWGMQ